MIAAAVGFVQRHPEADTGLTQLVEAHLGDDARPGRSLRDSCAIFSPGKSGMRCKRPKGHPIDSDRPHTGFDRAGRMRSWKAT